MKLTLTENEIKAIKLTLNYNDRESQLSDNFSNAGMDEMMEEFNWTRHQVAALMGSLEKKRLGFYDSEDGLFWLTEKGVVTIFNIIDAEQAQAQAA